MSRDRSGGRRLASKAGAVALLLFVGLVVTSGPARRPAHSPVFLSRASGQAEPAGETSEQRLGDVGISGPYVAVAPAASTSGDVRQLKPMAPVVVADARPELEARQNEQGPKAVLGDSVLQAPSGPSRPSQAMPRLLQNFAGLDFSNNGSGWPPDTNGDVGPNHYVQVVNTSVGVYSKTGELATPALTFDALFSNSSTVCAGNNRGDPVALYDTQRDRWIVADFAWANLDDGPYYECIAASKTSDPTGDWWTYALRADDDAHPWLNDYPKLGVWPDGIYMSANMFDCVSTCGPMTQYKGARVWAISPTQLYNGAVLTTVVFDAGPSYFGLLPSNLRGAAPPAGTPNYFVSNDINVTALDVFKFHVDWTHPLNSTFIGPTQVSAAAYTAPPDTVPQLNGGGLDSLGDRLMMQNQYRNISGDESLWLVHTVASSPTSTTGIRWYQLSVTGGAVGTTAAQQGTFAPADSVNRWMPSLAVDQFGNMAVGYSTSNASQFPGIRYAGRLVSDTVNTLGQDEALFVAGGGAQTTPCGGSCANRWGDYSAMTVDPVDDCTFWYTTEYYATSGQDWKTRIGSFRYPICGPVPPPLAQQVYLPVISIDHSTGAWSTLMQEGFEGAWPSAGWQISDLSLGGYFWGRRTCRASSGSFSAWAIGGGSLGQGLACGASYVDFTNSWMVYGPFSLADATSADFGLQLWLHSEIGYDTVCLWASIDNFNATGGGVCLSGDSGGAFVPETLDLSNVYSLGSLIGQPNVWVALRFHSDVSNTYPEGAYVDDLLLRKCTSSCTSSATGAASSLLQRKTAALSRP